MIDPALLASFPASARRLIDILGARDGLRVLVEYGRKDVYVPITTASNAGKRLAARVGPTAAAKLVATFGGKRMYVPLGHYGTTRLRNCALIADHQRGMTADDLVDKYEITRRHVRRILASR